MDITLQTKVASLLENYPGLEATLLQLSPAFAKLQNPVLRRTVAKVASLQQAAQIAGIPPGELVQALRKAAGLSPATSNVEPGAIQEDVGIPRPEWVDETAIVSTINAEAIVAAGGSPMQDILQEAGKLKDKEILRVVISFRPVPIIELLQTKGFRHWYDGKSAYFCL